MAYLCLCVHPFRRETGPQREKFTACELKMHASHTDTKSLLLLEADCCAKAGNPYLLRFKKSPHAFVQLCMDKSTPGNNKLSTEKYKLVKDGDTSTAVFNSKFA